MSTPRLTHAPTSVTRLHGWTVDAVLLVCVRSGGTRGTATPGIVPSASFMKAAFACTSAVQPSSRFSASADHCLHVRKPLGVRLGQRQGGRTFSQR